MNRGEYCVDPDFSKLACSTAHLTTSASKSLTSSFNTSAGMPKDGGSHENIIPCVPGSCTVISSVDRTSAKVVYDNFEDRLTNACEELLAKLPARLATLLADADRNSLANESVRGRGQEHRYVTNLSREEITKEGFYVSTFVARIFGQSHEPRLCVSVTVKNGLFVFVEPIQHRFDAVFFVF